MKAMLAFFRFGARRAAHDDNLRANQFDDGARFSPYVAMLPHIDW